MKAYRRILVPIFHSGESDSLLHSMQAIVAEQQAQVLVLRLVESRSSFDPDGPGANLSEEVTGRRAIDVQRRLDLQLARMNLGWVETRAFWHDTEQSLRAVVRDWQPELIIASRGSLPADLPAGIDILYTSRRSLMRRLADALTHREPGTA